MLPPRRAIVAGQICLDIIPDVSAIDPGTFNANFRPGHLLEAGAATLSTGGPVSNTGLALRFRLKSLTGGNAPSDLVSLRNERGERLAIGDVSLISEDKLVALDPQTDVRRVVPLAPAPYHLGAVRGTGKLYVSSRKEPKTARRCVGTATPPSA